MQKLKRLLTALFAVCALFYGLYDRPAVARTAGPPISRTGAPALGTNSAELTCTGCHTANPLNAPGGSLWIVAPDTYIPGDHANSHATVTVNIARGEFVKFGFQITALDEQGNMAGEFTLTDPRRTQLQTSTGTSERQYVTHTAVGTTATQPGQTSWTFEWHPPDKAVGRIMFYAAGNASNSSNTNAGDFIYTTTKAIYAPGFAAQSVTAVSAASYARAAASESIMALFGSNLATASLAAATNPLPTTLGGLRVVIHDWTTHIERDAPLFFVGPNQINFLIPAGVSNGRTTVSVLRDNTAFASGELTVSTVVPALFTYNATGQGVPAAVALRVKGGVQTFESIAQLNGTTWQASPLDLGAADEQVFLILFGTGFRNRGLDGTATATIGGAASTNVIAVPQGELIGLDQANVLIPRSLIGRGNVDVVLTVNGQPANTVQINVK